MLPVLLDNAPFARPFVSPPAMGVVVGVLCCVVCCAAGVELVRWSVVEEVLLMVALDADEREEEVVDPPVAEMVVEPVAVAVVPGMTVLAVIPVLGEVGSGSGRRQAVKTSSENINKI